MNKTYVLTFSISVLVVITVVIISLMILLPQSTTIVDSTITKYDSITKSDYLYTKTKDITKEALVQEYTINEDEMKNFKNKYQYVPGNSDPFTPYSDSSGGDNNGDGNSEEPSTGDKITNSNGGEPNPPSTSK